jgi:predicted methyltransferase
MEFFQVRPGLRVLDLSSAGGYYTELLARAVGPSGHVIAHNHPGAVTLLGEEKIRWRYRDGRLSNVEQLLARHGELRLPAESLDLVLLSMEYHDLYWYDPKVDWGPVDPVDLLRRLYTALRPDGIVGVIDHAAVTGTDPHEGAMALHRIDPAVVVRDFRLAGFVLEAQSHVLRNEGDDHLRGVFDPAIQGRTDRFVLRFRRPWEPTAK